MSASFGKFALTIAAVAMLALPATARAQGNGPGTWQFEAGGGVALPLSSALKDLAKTGADFDVLIGYQVHERIGLNAYGGLSLLKGETDSQNITTGSNLPDVDIWRFGVGAEASLTKPGNAFVALLGVGVGAANVKWSATELALLPPVQVPSLSSTSFSALTALKFLYKVNPNFAIGAGAEAVLVFSADTWVPNTQGETFSYLPVKIFLRWMQ
jgi:hypothetical protein